jgi:phenylpyruvate tautomerase PptA (4-oxalocrotonate tautomerase family)
MPLARIEVRKSRSPEVIADMIEAVYQAQREALQVPADDRQIRYVEYNPAHFAVPPGKTENYTLVEITVFPGRSLEAKRNLYQSIVRRFGALGIDPADILIVLHEPPLENWGLQGGRPACEVDLGFSLDV